MIILHDLSCINSRVKIRVIRRSRGIAALGRRQVGVAVGLRNFIVVASLQPGAGIGVGGKALWAACAVPPPPQTAGGRGKIATVSSGGTGMVTANGMPPGPARVRAGLYVHERTP